MRWETLKEDPVWVKKIMNLVLVKVKILEETVGCMELRTEGRSGDRWLRLIHAWTTQTCVGGTEA